MWIPLKDIELKEPYTKQHGTLFGKYANMPRETRPPILVFGKRHRKDTFQVFEGHHRTLAAKKKGEKTILAWVTKVTRLGRSTL